MFAGSRQRLRMARDRRHSGAVRIFALLEVICFYFSFAALAFLGADLFLYYTVGFKLSGFWHAVLSISLTAAVGFLTNWIAIEMLFRPYRPIPWLFVWPQGLVPRNQAKIGEKAGEAVSSELLNPEKVTDRLCACVSDSLDDEQVRKEAAAQIDAFTGNEGHRGERFPAGSPARTLMPLPPALCGQTDAEAHMISAFDNYAGSGYIQHAV